MGPSGPVPLPSLSRSTKLLYGFGSVAFGIKDQGFAYLLLLYYNQVLGLPEDWIGLGILVALVLDAFIDPVVGYASDNLHSRWGRRHPFMYAAALPVAVSYYLLWTPRRASRRMRSSHISSCSQSSSVPSSRSTRSRVHPSSRS